MSEKNEIVIYTTPEGKETFEVNLEKDTVWLNLNQISKLFKRDKSVISRHIKIIFDTEELNRKSVVAKFATTATDGKVYQVDYYNLDLIISVGYRVNSKRGTQFRIWATNVLKDHLIKGYTILLFLWFLNKNGILYNEDGSKRIADNALVALTLLIAESRAEEKDTMVKVVVNLINQNN
jgi:hypothetical protein